MADAIKAGTVVIKDGTVLPEGLGFESEACVPGWKAIKYLDAYALDQKVSEAGWTFFFRAGELKPTVFGIDREQMARRAIARILSDPRSKKFNSLEIIGVTSVGSERFPAVRFVTVAANPRHIQEGLVLFSVKGAVGSGPTKIANKIERAAGFTTGKRLGEETLRQRDLAAVSNS